MTRKVLICGLGSIGKRHAKILQNTFGCELSALRTYQGQEKNDVGVPEFTSWSDIKKGDFDLALISNPTHLHVDTAQECADRKMHIFLEKPIGSSWQGVEKLIETARENRLTIYVGYQLRFHPVLQKVKQWLKGKRIYHSRIVCVSYLPRWRSKQNHLESYTAHKDQGGGIILDLSHELDYIEYLFGPVDSIDGTYGCSSDVTVDSEDFGDLIVSHSRGITNVHLNSFSHMDQRFCEIDTAEGYLKANLITGEIKTQINDKMLIQKVNFNMDQVFVEQFKYLFENLNNPNLINNLSSASHLFRKMVEFKQTHESTCYNLR